MKEIKVGLRVINVRQFCFSWKFMADLFFTNAKMCLKGDGSDVSCQYTHTLHVESPASAFPQKHPLPAGINMLI
jgi:hypothetical protein